MKNKIFLSLITILVLMSGCKKEDSTTSPDDSKVGGSLTYNGYTYHTVTIGTQEWTVENLRTIHYNDGSIINKVTENTVWLNMTTGAYCAYNNDESNVITYGYIYNWYAVNTEKLAPKTGGWRIPTDADWTKLTDFVGTNDGTKLKSKSGWNNNGNGTDDHGFNALPGGGRYFYGQFNYLGSSGYWWSSSLNDSDFAWYRGIGFGNAEVGRSESDKRYGLSIRLVRDR